MNKSIQQPFQKCATYYANELLESNWKKSFTNPIPRTMFTLELQSIEKDYTDVYNMSKYWILQLPWIYANYIPFPYLDTLKEKVITNWLLCDHNSKMCTYNGRKGLRYRGRESGRYGGRKGSDLKQKIVLYGQVNTFFYAVLLRFRDHLRNFRHLFNRAENQN